MNDIEARRGEVRQSQMSLVSVDVTDSEKSVP